jgi:hypothetical protein
MKKKLKLEILGGGLAQELFDNLIVPYPMPVEHCGVVIGRIHPSKEHLLTTLSTNKVKAEFKRTMGMDLAIVVEEQA